MLEKDTDILNIALKIQNKIYKLLLGLFYPWNRLYVLWSGYLKSLYVVLYKNTWLIELRPLVSLSLPSLA